MIVPSGDTANVGVFLRGDSFMSANDDNRTTRPTLETLLEVVRALKEEQGIIRADQKALHAQIENIDGTIIGLDESIQEAMRMAVQQLTAIINATAQKTATEIKNSLAVVGFKIDALNRGRLQTEADYESLLQRILELESKAS